MKKSIIFFTLFLLLTSCGTGGRKLYLGPEQPIHKMSVYSLWNYSSFGSNNQIYTIQMDQTNFESEGGLGNVPAKPGNIVIEPGHHSVKVSFVNSNNQFFFNMFKSNVFSGWYDIKFNAKPGKLYAPMFDLKLEESKWLEHMCIVEVEQSEGVSATRKSTNYIACSEPTLAPTPENLKLCESDWSLENMSTCKHILEEQ